MSVELINCAVCGHVVATDARCCPHCGTTSYNAKKIETEARNREAAIEKRQLERENKR